MKCWLAAVLCVALLPVTAAFAQQAGDPATKEDVQKFFDLTDSRKQFDALMSAFTKQIQAQNQSLLRKQSENLTPKQAAQLNAFVNNSVQNVLQNMPYEEMMQAIMPAYQHHFTHGEMQELIRFNASPLGKKLRSQMPAIMTESMQALMPIMQRRTEASMADLRARTEEYSKTLTIEKKTVPASLSTPLN